MRILVKRSRLRLASIGLGLLFIAGYIWFFHFRLDWDWAAPGTGKLPQEIVTGFLGEAYGRGRGADAVEAYFAADSVDTAPDAEDRRNGAPIPHEVRWIVAQGQSVVVHITIAPARGAPGLEAIDLFKTNRGRIVSRQRYVTGASGATQEP